MSLNIYSRSIITSKHLEANYHQQLFRFFGDVVYQNSSMKISVNNLVYDQNHKTVDAKGQLLIHLYKDDLEIFGEHLSQTSDYFHITGKHHKKITVNDLKNNRSIKSDGILINRKNKFYIFTGNSVVNSNEFKILNQSQIQYKLKEFHFKDSTTILLQKKENLQIHSHDIVFSQKKNKILFPYLVKIEKKNDYKIQSNYGDFNIKNKMFTLDGNVIYTKKDLQIHSDHFYSQEKNKKTSYSFSKKIRFQYQNFKGKSSFIQFIPSQKKLAFVDNVFIKDQDSSIEIQSNLMDIYPNQKKVFFYRNVKMKIEAKKAFADTAYYDNLTHYFVLKGNTSYDDGSNTYSASQIMINKDTKQISLLGNIKGKSAISQLEGVQIGE